MRISIFAVAITLLAVGCSLKLEQPEAPPEHPIEGLWVDATYDPTDPEFFRMLYISSGGLRDHPYEFSMFQFYRRDMVLSGKRLYIIRRHGFIETSAREVLLTQNKFVFLHMNSEASDDNWPVQSFSEEKVERTILTVGPLDLFDLSEDGRMLAGDDYTFVRPVAVEGAPGPITELDIGIVARISEQDLVLVSFSPAIMVQGQTREAWSAQGKEGSFEIAALRGNLTGITNVNGGVEPGQIAVLPGFRVDQPYRRQLTREEIRQRLQRGEPVSREDLLRVLGDE